MTKFAYLIEPPFNFRDENGNVHGCDVDLARRVFATLGNTFEPVETEFAELLPGVAAGRWRMTTGLFATPERRKQAAFSRPIWALPDGLLVQQGNPLGLTGYRSAARNRNCRMAVIRDQFQHRSAVEFGMPDDRIRIFETYTEAAEAVRNGRADAYASVARAHTGFLDRNPDYACDVVSVPADEKQPAFGCFAFALEDTGFRHAVDEVLEEFLGSPDHRSIMTRHGFTDPEVDLVL